MLNSDIFLNILKYLDIYQWNEYINMNKKLKNYLFKKMGLIKKYFRMNKYPKWIPLYLHKDPELYYHHQREYRLKLTLDEFYFYLDLARKKYPKRKIIDIEKYGIEKYGIEKYDNKKNIIIRGDAFDEEIFLELYEKKGVKSIGKEDPIFTDYSPYAVGEVPYEYYINNCYKIKNVLGYTSEQGGISVFEYEKLKLLHDKLKVIKCENKIKVLEEQIEILKNKN